MAKHVFTLTRPRLLEGAGEQKCGGCQVSCQSACKTSCTVGNQACSK